MRSLCLVGLSHGFLEDSQRRTRGIGADVIVRPPGSTLLTLSGGISDKIVDWLGQQPHVKIAVGAVNQPVQGITLGATGINLKQFDQMKQMMSQMNKMKGMGMGMPGGMMPGRR